MKLIHKTQTQYEGRSILIEHDRKCYIRIFDEPEGLPYEHEGKRNVHNETHMLQDIQMMDFQAKVSSLLRMSLQDAGMSYPLIGEYNIEIEINSSRGLSEIPLIAVLKSIMDGINRQIVADDKSISSCSLRYQRRAVALRNKVSRSSDDLTVRIFDCNASSSMPVAEFNNVFMHVVPKVEPLKLDADNDTILLFGEYDYQEAIAVSLQKDGMRIIGGRPYRINFLFLCKTLANDIDNMARMYYPVLEHLGLGNHDVVEVVLAKQKSKPKGKSCVQIVMTPV